MELTRKGVLRTAWTFSLLIWGYVIVDRWVNPQLQKLNMSPYVPIPQDLVGILAFVVALVTFAFWSSMKDPP